jgi:hypothetical protein
MKNILVFVVVMLLLSVGVELAAREWGGEVVTLYTTDGGGRTYSNDVWVVETGQDLWIRSVRPTSPWLDRLVADPAVQLQRGMTLQTYRATPLAHRRDRINAAMAERYGWADWLLSLVEDRQEAVPVFLDPFG